MIATNTLEVVTPQARFLLGPFNETHMRQVLPISMDTLAYQPAVCVPYFTAAEPGHWLEGEAEIAGTTWGIFDPEPECDTQPTGAGEFLGTIALHAGTVDGTQTEIVQGIDTMLFSRQHMGRGVGTLAKLAVAKYAFGRNTHALHADTSTENAAAQRSLEKAGFTRFCIGESLVELANGSRLPMENWWLMDEAALAASANDPQIEQLTRGWQVYQEATRNVELRELQAGLSLAENT